MIGSTEIKSDAVRFSEILAQDRPYSFRLPAPEQEQTLKAEIAMLGLLYPLTVEEANAGQYTLLDGHRRFDAIQALRRESGGWEEIPAVIYKQNQLLTHEKLILLKEKNMTGDHAYTLVEKARLLDAFLKRGLSPEEMAEHSALPPAEIKTLLYLMEAPQGLMDILIQTPMSPLMAQALIQRFERWTATPYKDLALPTARKIAAHLSAGPVSPLGAKFLLDFYWSQRPFMAPRVSLP